MTAILIIDDDVALLATLAAQLEDAAFEVLKSSDLGHAEALFSERHPDLVVLEVQMNGGSGWDLLAWVSGQAPVIVLSRAGREEDVVRGFTAGAVDYIAKPYRSAELLARVRARLAAAAAPAWSPPPANPAPPIVPAPGIGPTPLPQPRREPPRRADDASTSVFMSEAEEMALLRTPAPAPPAPVAAAADAAGLGARLRAERMRRQYTLVQVENELKIRMSYLQAMEDEKFTLLPRGPVALQMVRSYANHLGLPADEVVGEFRQNYYIEPAPPPPALGGARLPRTLPRWLIWLTAIIFALAVAIGAIVAFDPDFFLTLPEQLQPLLPPWAGGA